MSAKSTFKRQLAVSMTVLAGTAAVIGLWALWVLMTTFAAGLVWWAGASVLLAGPLALAGLLVAVWRPRQKALAWINGAIAIVYTLVWAALIARAVR